MASKRLQDPIEERGRFKTLLGQLFLLHILKKLANSRSENLISAGMSQTDSSSEATSLTKDEVFGNIFFIMLAGYDTASTTISFALLLLALHQEHQKNLQQHIDVVLGPSRDASCWDLHANLQPLLDGPVGAVIKETLRLYCPIEWLPKIAVRDTTVTDSSGVRHFVAQGTTCCINFAATFRHPEHWDSPAMADKHDQNTVTPPLQFDPSRWTRIDNSEMKIHPEAYFPFGGGQRRCPGRKFAEILMAAVLCRILSEFSVEIDVSENLLTEATAKRLGKSWAEQKARDMAITGLYDGIGFHHGIYPERHVPIKFVPRELGKL